METKQTAVDWLITQLEGKESLIARIVGLKEYNQIIKQAKQMEKEQAMDLMSNACMFLSASFHDEDFKSMTYEDVYNKYYNA